VDNRGKERGRRRAYRTGRRIGYSQIGVVGFDSSEFAYERVILGVGNLGSIEVVISVVVILDLVPKLFSPGGRIDPTGRVGHAAIPEPITASGLAGS
jgi:hypothetical protein